MVVETKNLCKYYDGVKAVENLNLRIRRGEIYGFLGPNGAGKTTTILMLLGLTEPTSGEVRVCGHDSIREPLEVKRITGYLPENVGFYEDLTARENLRYIARLNGIPDRESARKIDEVLEKVGLLEVADWPVGKFSRGMKQRLGIADVLIKDPLLAILDEPTAGIDPEGANQILELIVDMSRERNMTVMLASHLLHQVQRICDRVGILSKGRLVAEGTVDELGARIIGEGGATVEVQVSKLTPDLLQAVKRIRGVREVEASGNTLRIRCDGDLRAQISRAIAESGGTLLELRGQLHTLEEIYLRYFREE
ncbi:MAG TPA: ABC transporter ATP-binding protein [Anaerolineae bacterium]|nr:ABC transporter ATP-binding protein [Anaerolineae bacterium]